MEMGGGGGLGGSGGSSTNSSTESPTGLKFGKKIYFEDAGVAGSSSSSSGSGRRGRGGGGGSGHGGQPPRCQVEDCKLDLSDAKPYYSRHKVCGMHSKSPKVIVAGLEQRFCQQCSRFHQLTEFDQRKRSCRRRLAGHNERRRKPQPGSLLPSRYGRLSSSIFGNTGLGGSFLMDPTAWPTTRSCDHITGPHSTAIRRSLTHPWQFNSENPPSEIFQQGVTSFSCPRIISPGESFKGVADSSCALSLLSNQQQPQQQQPWVSSTRAASSFNLMNAEGVSVAQPAPPALSHGCPPTHHHYQNTSWGYKGCDAGSSSHDISPVLGLGQISQPVSSQIAGGEFDLSQQDRRQYMGPEQTRCYDSSSTQHVNWSL